LHLAAPDVDPVRRLVAGDLRADVALGPVARRARARAREVEAVEQRLVRRRGKQTEREDEQAERLGRDRREKRKDHWSPREGFGLVLRRARSSSTAHSASFVAIVVAAAVTTAMSSVRAS